MKSKIIINGGKSLHGKIKNQVSKNASLPILSACLLACDEISLFDLPNLSDINNMKKILLGLGVEIKQEGNITKINPQKASFHEISEKLSKSMRSSIFLLGPLLARFKCASISMPGGCKIGERPIDIHLKGLKTLGVKMTSLGDKIFFNALNSHSGTVKLKIPSVGATENLVMFACTQKGKTTLKNVAREPEVVDLCSFLNKMGAKIYGAGTKKIVIHGVENLKGTTYKPMYDRIVAGTIMTAVAGCGGEVEIENACSYENEKLIEILTSFGCQISSCCDIIKIQSDKNLMSCGQIETGFYPEFPTDLQSMILVLSCVAIGETTIVENVFENRFLMTKQLEKLHAKIQQISSHAVKINSSKLIGNEVQAKDLRGGASLVLAGLFAEGETKIKGVEFIDRGYESIETIFSSLGADIKRI